MENFQGRILLVSAIPPPVGGDATWALEFIDYCKQNKAKIDVVNTSISGKRALAADDVWNIRDEVKRCFRIWRDVLRCIRLEHPNIVHLNTNCSPKGVVRDYISTMIVRLYGIPYVLHCHCNIDDQLGKSRCGAFFLKKMITKSKKTLVLNHKSYEYAEKNIKNKTMIIPNPISAETIKVKKINQELKQVLFVGHVKKTKGIDELIEVAKKNPTITFLIAGPITEDYKDKENTFPGNTIILGSITKEKVYELLDETDVFLFPTYTEGFSLSLLEAMAHGVPCLTTNAGANYEMIENKGGVVVPVKDIEALCNGLKQMESLDVRKRMSQWNIEKVKKSYTSDKVFDSLINIYGEVLNENAF